MILLCEIKKLYFEESQETIDSIRKSLEKLLKHQNDIYSLNKLLNGTHTLCGNSFQMGFNKIGKLAELVLGFFSGIENGEKKLTEKEFRVLKQAIDALEEAIKSKKIGKKCQIEETLFKKIKVL